MPAALQQIGSITLQVATSTIALTNLPQGFRDIRVIITATSGTPQNMSVAFNNDSTTSNYPSTYATGNGSSTGSGNLDCYIGGVYGTSLSMNEIDIFNYSSSATQKTWLSRLGVVDTTLNFIAGRWANTSPITSIQFILSGTTFSVGTTVGIYGVSA